MKVTINGITLELIHRSDGYFYPVTCQVTLKHKYDSACCGRCSIGFLPCNNECDYVSKRYSIKTPVYMKRVPKEIEKLLNNETNNKRRVV